MTIKNDMQGNITGSEEEWQSLMYSKYAVALMPVT